MERDATFDHVTVAVFDLDEAIQFFGVLGFEIIKNVRISGATMDAYMGIPGMEADHVTLAVPDAEPHQEVQLLHFHKPAQLVDRSSGNLAGTGFNHICFRVDGSRRHRRRVRGRRLPDPQPADGLPRPQARLPHRPRQHRRRARPVALT